MSIAKRIVAVMLACFLSTIAFARTWPDGNGGLIRGDIILLRSNEVVVLTEVPPHRYVSIPIAKLRDLDIRYLRRLTRNSLTDSVSNLPILMRAIADIHDANTLLFAASFFRQEDKQFAVERFAEYLEHCKADHRLEQDNLWPLASVIFKHPLPLYPDFWTSNAEPVNPRWPQSSCEDIRLVNDTLFWVPSKFGHSGPCWPDADGLLPWIRDYARLRDDWIHPNLPPTVSVQALGDDAKHCRQQAWQLVAHLFDENWQIVFAASIDDERWERLVEMVDALDIEWDVNTQKFKKTTKAIIPPPPDQWLPKTFIGVFR